jgi:gas vesicle protein
MKAFLFGLGLGIALGVLFAPVSGEEARDNIAGRATDLANSAKQTVDSARQSIEHGRERLRNSIGAVRDKVSGEARPTGTETSAV